MKTNYDEEVKRKLVVVVVQKNRQLLCDVEIRTNSTSDCVYHYIYAYV